MMVFKDTLENAGKGVSLRVLLPLLLLHLLLLLLLLPLLQLFLPPAPPVADGDGVF